MKTYRRLVRECEGSQSRSPEKRRQPKKATGSLSSQNAFDNAFAFSHRMRARH